MNVKRKSHPAGFTMVELLLTIIISGIATFVIVKSFDSSEAHVQNAMMKIASNIRYAQDRAMVTGRVHGFKTTGNSTYQIYDQIPGNLTLDPSTMSSMQIDLNQDFPGVQFGSSYQIEFNSYGAPTFGAGLSVVLSKGSASRTFIINNNTGTLDLP